VDKEALDKFLAEFRSLKRVERRKLMDEISVLDEQVYQKELDLLRDRVTDLFESHKKEHGFVQILHAERWWTFIVGKVAITIWPDAGTNNWYVLNRSRHGAIKVPFGKSNDEVLKTKIQTALNKVLTIQVLES
jgi:hypothetical protein